MEAHFASAAQPGIRARWRSFWRRGESPKLRSALRRQEFDPRSDVFTHDAFAWALAAAGDLTEADPRCILRWPKAPKTGGFFSTPR